MTEPTAPKNFNQKESLQSLDTDDWLRQLVINLPQGILLSNSERRIMYMNQQLIDIFNLKINPEDFFDRPVISIISLIESLLPDYKKQLDRINELVANSKPVYKDPLLLSNGKIITRDYIPVWKDGKFEGNMWIFYDETENMQASKRVKEQKQFYEDILNHIPTDIAVFSSDLQYLFANPISIKDPEIRNWVIGKTDFDYCLKTGKEQLIENRKNMFSEVIEKKTEKEWEEKLINEKGQAEYYLRRLSPVFEQDKRLKLVIGYGLNITELKKIESQIKINEKRLKDLFNFSQAIICTHTLEGNLIEVNPAVCELTEFSEEEITGKNINEFLWDEDKEKFTGKLFNPN